MVLALLFSILFSTPTSFGKISQEEIRYSDCLLERMCIQSDDGLLSREEQFSQATTICQEELGFTSDIDLLSAPQIYSQLPNITVLVNPRGYQYIANCGSLEFAPPAEVSCDETEQDIKNHVRKHPSLCSDYKPEFRETADPKLSCFGGQVQNGQCIPKCGNPNQIWTQVQNVVSSTIDWKGERLKSRNEHVCAFCSDIRSVRKNPGNYHPNPSFTRCVDGNGCEPDEVWRQHPDGHGMCAPKCLDGELKTENGYFQCVQKDLCKRCREKIQNLKNWSLPQKHLREIGQRLGKDLEELYTFYQTKTLARLEENLRTCEQKLSDDPYQCIRSVSDLPFFEDVMLPDINDLELWQVHFLWGPFYGPDGYIDYPVKRQK